MQKTSCANCGVEFSLPDDLMMKLRQTGKTFYCPNGHSLVFTPSENEKLKKQVADLEKRLSWAMQDADYYRGLVTLLREEVRTYQGKYSGYKSQYLRLKKSMRPNIVSAPIL
jgi:hypothetical protein